MKIGVIGGSGLEKADVLRNASEKEVETPYGKPSSPLLLGSREGKNVVILSRHGKRHQFPPTAVNNRANIWALKQEGCTHILATTAVGSLRKDIKRGDVVVLDQFIDFTRHRKITFHDLFEGGMVHTAMPTPFDEHLRNALIAASRELGFDTHETGTVVTIEGPRFSTKAEAKMFRMWEADVINMSIAPEAILANELGIPYAVVALSTDYDCLFDDVPPVTWEEVLKVFAENVEKKLKRVFDSIE